MEPTLPPAETDPPLATDLSPYAIRGIFLLMPYLPLTGANAIDYDAADPAVLAQLADTAEAIILMAGLSVSAIGRVLSRLSLFGTTDEVATDTIEALGWLLGELGDFTNLAFTIATTCRAQTFDYQPGEIEIIPLVKP